MRYGFDGLRSDVTATLETDLKRAMELLEEARESGGWKSTEDYENETVDEDDTGSRHFGHI